VIAFRKLDSNIFWNETDERRLQKLYVALCLFISAASDFAVGIDLKNSGKLNWSTTASYYSIFHSARLIIFLALGNYPKSHNISQLFAQNPISSVKLDALEFNVHTVALTTAISHYYKDLLNLPNSEFLFNSIR
jgi:hypothetical protein